MYSTVVHPHRKIEEVMKMSPNQISSQKNTSMCYNYLIYLPLTMIVLSAVIQHCQTV